MIALDGLPALPRLSLTQWLLVGSATINAVLLIALYGLQVDLPVIGTLGPDGVIAERDEARAQVAALTAASEQARKDAIAARNREALALIELKDVTDETRDQIERTNLERARAFAAAGGVRPQCDRGRASAPVAAPADRSAESGDGAGAVPELDDLRAGSLVTVTARDVEVCTVNTSRLLAAQPWGVQLEARNREPVEP